MTLRQPAAPGERFTDSAAEANIGKTIPVNLAADRAQGTILAAVVVDDGRALEVTVEVAEGDGTQRLEAVLAPRVGRFSIGAKPPSA